MAVVNNSHSVVTPLCVIMNALSNPGRDGRGGGDRKRDKKGMAMQKAGDLKQADENVPLDPSTIQHFQWKFVIRLNGEVLIDV